MDNVLSVVLQKCVDGVMHTIYPQTISKNVICSDNEDLDSIIAELRGEVATLKDKIQKLESDSVRSDEDPVVDSNE